GTAFSFTVTALDASNNTATTYAGMVHFTSTDASATLPADSTLTNGAGTFNATLRTAGSRTITATDTVTSSITGTSGGITVGGIHGDANGDGVVNVADVFYLINYLFTSGPPPVGPADVNGDGLVTVADIFYLINYLFAGGPAPL